MLTNGESMRYSIIGLLILILDIYCIYLIVTGSGDLAKKLAWVIIILLLPLLGAILYLIFGRSSARV
jgi:hypothetical protein